MPQKTLLNKTSVPATSLPNHGLKYEHNARHLLYTKKNTPSGLLLKSCQKRLKAGTRAGGEVDSVIIVRKDLGMD